MDKFENLPAGRLVWKCW